MTNVPEDEPLSAAESELQSAEDQRTGHFVAQFAAYASGQLVLNGQTEAPAAERAAEEALPAEALPAEAEPAPVEPAPPAPSFTLAAEKTPQFDTAQLEAAPAPSEPAAPALLSFAPPPPVQQPPRIPHFGHLLMLGLILMCALVITLGAWLIALRFHLYGVSTLQASATEIHYTLGSEGLIYVLTLVGCLVIFPLFWNEGYFSGIHWCGATAVRLKWWLLGAAFVCFLLALLSSWAFPGPTHTPIEEVFREPGAAWLLMAFGVTFAPFFEEMFFRGFLLPALCTACDWIAEKIGDLPRRPSDVDGNPRWSIAAMAIGSVLTSIPFAGMHAAQTGYSLGPFLLLVGVSIVLCAVRLKTRSLAASTLVHACYNLMLFSIMLIGTQGFRHMDKL